MNHVNYEVPEKVRQRVNFDNLTPLYPEERLKLEVDDPTSKDLTTRVIDLVSPYRQGPACACRRPAQDR